jgi:carboxymethylproline synthase
MFDWRIVSTRACFIMPELEHGIGASMASAILSTTSGYDVARRIVISCQPISAAEAVALHLADEVAERELLLDRAVARAGRLGDYPFSSFSQTKRALTGPLRAALTQTREQSKLVHRAAFRAKAMHGHMDRVLNRAPASATSR